ncbi:MAG: hypothetical protein Q9186_003079 [Xanthomendoza sp. 1 TL-2023]
MAINVYLTLFKKYNGQQLKALEWRYHIMCYAIPFIVALVYLFVDTSSRGRIYGDASLWCWISIKWVILRIALCYIPAWIAILVSFTLYAMSGREIFLKRQQLRAFHSSSPNPVANPFTSFKTTEVEITSELADLPSRNHDQYSIKISSSAMSPTFSDAPTVVPPTPTTTNAVQCRNNRAAMEANTAAWGYTKVPSSMNRVYSLIYPGYVSIPFTYASAVVLPLMGFWNSVIYVTTSWSACKGIVMTCSDSVRMARIHPIASIPRLRRRRGRSKDDHGPIIKKDRDESSLSDSTRGFAYGDTGNVV